VVGDLLEEFLWEGDQARHTVWCGEVGQWDGRWLYCSSGVLRQDLVAKGANASPIKMAYHCDRGVRGARYGWEIWG
jgi:hypothetical protein